MCRPHSLEDPRALDCIRRAQNPQPAPTTQWLLSSGESHLMALRLCLLLVWKGGGQRPSNKSAHTSRIRGAPPFPFERVWGIRERALRSLHTGPPRNLFCLSRHHRMRCLISWVADVSPCCVRVKDRWECSRGLLLASGTVPPVDKPVHMCLHVPLMLRRF